MNTYKLTHKYGSIDVFFNSNDSKQSIIEKAVYIQFKAEELRGEIYP